MPTAQPEYCLFWIDHWTTCMQKGEWSGWAQACGALLALALAIGLQIKSRADARVDAKDMAASYVSQLTVVSAVMGKACAEQKWEDFRAGRHAFADACSMAQAVPYAHLRGDALACFMSLRSLAVELHVKSEGHTAAGNWGHWRQEFIGFGAQAAKAIAMINNAK